MARRKNHPEAVRAKCSLAERLRQVRTELFGERGGPEMARRLGVPVRTWYNYEAGVTVPAEVVLRFVELTAVEPLWLLHGKGPKFRASTPVLDPAGGESSVRNLLQTVLQRLENRRLSRYRVMPPLAADPPHDPTAPGGQALRGRDECDPRSWMAPAGSSFTASRHEWLAAERENRCVRNEGDAMTPIIADGAHVAFAETDEGFAALEGKLVVAWVGGQALVRWFQHSGRFAVLRAENPAVEPLVIDIDGNGPGVPPRFRRVLWISTPH
jgi:hypothetical protein